MKPQLIILSESQRVSLSALKDGEDRAVTEIQKLQSEIQAKKNQMQMWESLKAANQSSRSIVLAEVEDANALERGATNEYISNGKELILTVKSDANSVSSSG